MHEKIIDGRVKIKKINLRNGGGGEKLAAEF